MVALMLNSKNALYYIFGLVLIHHPLGCKCTLMIKRTFWGL